jgi:hypothetical protein
MLSRHGTLRLHGSFDEEILLIPSWRWHSLRREGEYREADRWRAVWILNRLSDCDLLQARDFIADAELPFYDRMFALPRKSDHEVRSTIIRAIEDHRVIAIRRGAGPARGTPDKGAPIELRRLVEQVERLGKLSLESRQYKLVVADDLGKVPNDRYQVVLQADARAVLAEMAKGSPAHAEVLRKASEKIGEDGRTPVSQPDGLVLLRWAPGPSFAPKTDDGPAITPSQMKGMFQKDWIEIEVVDQDGEPYPTHYRLDLPSSDIREDELDENGCVNVSGIASGTCKLTVGKVRLAAEANEDIDEGTDEPSATEVEEEPAMAATPQAEPEAEIAEDGGDTSESDVFDGVFSELEDDSIEWDDEDEGGSIDEIS